MAREIKERPAATPYGFRFTTRERKIKDLDSKVIKSSGMYYLGGKIETLAEVESRNDPKESILRSNMKCNNIDRIITNNNSWKFTGPFEKEDILIEDFKP